MIGDNPFSDIEGANRQALANSESNGGTKNWISILVQTGVYKEGSDSNKADYIVEDLQAAYHLILEKEGLK